MGMYTEIFVNVDFKEDVPEDVLYVLKGMVREVSNHNNYDKETFDHFVVDYEDVNFKELTQKFPPRFTWLFSNGSYYTPNTTVAKLTYDHIGGQWSLIGKGDIKNYNDEIETFFKWIAPYCETEFMGYSRYEEDREPTLYYSGTI